jgi:hypothetical protein
MYEVRYRGGLLSEHATDDDARGHVDTHLKDVQDKHELAIAPARPVRVYCRGVLAETFLSPADAETYVQEHTSELAPAEAWWIAVGPNEIPEHPHEVWPIHVPALDVSDEATVWAESQRPVPVTVKKIEP